HRHPVVTRVVHMAGNSSAEVEGLADFAMRVSMPQASRRGAVPPVGGNAGPRPRPAPTPGRASSTSPPAVPRWVIMDTSGDVADEWFRLTTERVPKETVWLISTSANRSRLGSGTIG